MEKQNKQGKKEKREARKEKEVFGNKRLSEKNINCNDAKCPFHGKLSARGRIFEGSVTRKFPKRITIEFERMVYIKKFERYAKSKIKLHASLPECMQNEINIGDYVQIQECRPLSKIIKFVAIAKLSRVLGDRKQNV